MTKKSVDRSIRDAARSENQVFLDLVDALRARGAIDITAGPFRVLFAHTEESVDDEPVDTTPTTIKYEDESDESMLYWSST